MQIKVIDPVTGIISFAESNDGERVHSADASGVYMGLLPPASAVNITPDPPPAPTGWRWLPQAKRWQFVRTLVAAIKEAHTQLDAIAGEVRGKYITLTPGQDQVYTAKKNQAERYIEAYALNVNAPVPPYILAEAEADSVTNIVAANTIVSQATAWELISAQIEKSRRQGKVLISNATTVPGVSVRLNTASTALRAL